MQQGLSQVSDADKGVNDAYSQMVADMRPGKPLRQPTKEAFNGYLPDHLWRAPAKGLQARSLPKRSAQVSRTVETAAAAIRRSRTACAVDHGVAILSTGHFSGSQCSPGGYRPAPATLTPTRSIHRAS